MTTSPDFSEPHSGTLGERSTGLPKWMEAAAQSPPCFGFSDGQCDMNDQLFGYTEGINIYLSELAFAIGELQYTIAHEGAHIGGKDEDEAELIGYQCASTP